MSFGLLIQLNGLCLPFSQSCNILVTDSRDANLYTNGTRELPYNKNHAMNTCCIRVP
jgi:hypothetical protein